MKNLKDLHKEDERGVQAKKIFEPSQALLSLQILSGNQMKEHLTPTPAFLICVEGEIEYHDEKGFSQTMKSGDFYAIPPNVKHWLDAKKDSNLILVK